MDEWGCVVHIHLWQLLVILLPLSLLVWNFTQVGTRSLSRFFVLAKDMSSKPAKGVALLAQGVMSCSSQATVYGKCITARYQDVHKDMCVKEFEAFRSCVQRAVSWNLYVFLYSLYNM